MQDHHEAPPTIAGQRRCRVKCRESPIRRSRNLLHEAPAYLGESTTFPVGTGPGWVPPSARPQRRPERQVDEHAVVVARHDPEAVGGMPAEQPGRRDGDGGPAALAQVDPVSYTHLRAHETPSPRDS